MTNLGALPDPAAPLPPLSNVVATSQGWPEIEACLAALVPQARAAGAEIIVADGSGGAPPPPGLPPGVRWLSHPETGVFELRALATREARGAIVAITEDHCLVAPDWVARILAAHRAHPDAAAIKGAILNGSRERLVDWAAFLLNQAPHLPPFRGRTTDAVLNASSVAYARRVLAELAAREPEPLELRHPRTWRASGDRIVADERIQVRHFQSLGLRTTSALQYHTARTTAGIRRARMRGRDWVRLAAAPVLPFVRTCRTVATCLDKPVSRVTLLASVPLIFWLYCCKAAGELSGYLAGPGRSPTRMR